MSLAAMAYVSFAILAAYVGGIVFAILAPRKHRDPHDGMAVGCLTIAAIPGVVVAIVIGIGLAFDIPDLIRWPFRVLVVVAGYVLVLLIAQPIVRAWRNRQP